MAVSQRQQDIARIVRELVHEIDKSQHNVAHINTIGTLLAGTLGDDDEAVAGIIAGLIAALRPDLMK